MEEQKERQSKEKSLEVLKKGPFKPINTLKDQKNYLFDINVSPDGKKLVSTCGDHEFEIIDVASGCLIKSVNLEYLIKNDQIRFVFFHPNDSNRIFCGSFSNGISEWDGSGNFLRSFEDNNVSINSMAISPDGFYIATGGGYGPIVLWDVASAKPIWKNNEQTQNICLSFSPDGKTIASGHNDKSLKLWEANTGILIKKLEGHSCHVISVAFSPDGTQIASAGSSGDKTVRIWDVQTKKTIKTLVGHKDGIRCVKFSPDGRKIISGSTDKTIRVWDVDSGKEVELLEAHTAEVRCIIMMADGVGMISGGCDKKIKFWERTEGPEPTAGGCAIF